VTEHEVTNRRLSEATAHQWSSWIEQYKGDPIEQR
jgi:hypothetical protein